jgi:hypothetical protein
VSDENERKRRWLADYLDALPDYLRTTPQDPALQSAARVAYGNGWSPRRIAVAVATRSYDGVMFPSKIAIARLTEVGATAPRISNRPIRCGCDEPDCMAQSIPEEWAQERWALVRTLPRESLTEDQRERRMVDLIRAQEMSR